MQYGDPDLTWTQWVQANDDRGEDAKLLALREYIVRSANKWVQAGEVTAGWVNKKLAKLGIMERVDSLNSYTVEATVTGTTTFTVAGNNRAEAIAKFRELVDNRAHSLVISAAAISGDPRVVGGPEDADPEAVDADAPTTVDATLEKLREIILLGHLAGPRYCNTGANQVLRSYGLDEVPPVREYVVTRPVEATMRTVVRAYDVDSANRVAGWRWDEGRTGWDVSEAKATDDATVDVN